MRKLFRSIMRWIEVGLFSAIGLFAIYIGKNFVPKSFIDYLTNSDSFWPILGVGFSLLTCLNWISGFRFGHLRTILKYPSFLIGAVVVTIVVDCCRKTGTIAENLLSLPPVGFLTFVYIISLVTTGIIRFFSKSFFISTDPVVQNELSSLERLTGSALVQWSQCEAPTTNVAQDLFQLKFRADRILEYLKKERKNTVAVLGEYGAGKTTLTHFIKNEAKYVHQPSLQFVWVSCWGFEDSAAAQGAVLTQIVDSIADGVDSFALQGMPSKFVEALSRTSNYLESLFHFVSSNDPDSQLRRLSPILDALDVRLVVIIEDTDRKSVKFDLTSIEGLLNRFRDIPEISFVITAGPDAKIDFVRLCEHTELIPDLEPKMVLNILNGVREFCREEYPQDIDPVKRQNLRDTFLVPLMGKYGFWEFNLAALINTPRKLKATIRRFSDAWRFLHGEVDIDELLIASCLRICAPGAFSFLMRRGGEFPKLNAAAQKKPNEPDPYLIALKSEWSELRGQAFDMSAAANLLQILEPSVGCLFEEKAFRSAKLVQEFRNEKSTYRQRLFNERITDKGISDQHVLRAIADAKRGGSWKVIAKEIEESEDFRELFNLFAVFMLGNELTRGDFWQVIKETFRVLREKYGPKASQEQEVFTQLFQWSQRAANKLDGYYEVSYEIFEECIPESLRLGVGVFHYYFVHNGSQETIQTYGDRAMYLFKKIFVQDNPQILIDALDESHPSTLLDFLEFDHENNGATSKNWKKWRWIGALLLAGLKKEPTKMAPQIAVALGLTIDHPDLPEGFILNEVILDGVFGDFASAVMEELARPLKITTAMADYAAKWKGTDFSITHMRVQKWLKKKAEGR